jgi:cell filamentation protein
MAHDDRYDVSGLTEAQFEPGSNDLVLSNRLGIRTVQEMDEVEAQALEATLNWALMNFDEEHRFTSADVRSIHKYWLGEIYEWAGEYRQVNVTKGTFTFAMAARVPALMDEFEQTQLLKYTPCRANESDSILRTLAETHVELVLIHPFREGNGRTARTLSILMALQAGLPLLNFSLLAGERKQDYFAAIQSGLDRNYRPMEELFSAVIATSGA